LLTEGAKRRHDARRAVQEARYRTLGVTAKYFA
jgi:hypothetical protein